MGQCFTLVNLDRKETVPEYNKLLEDTGYPIAVVEELEILLLDQDAINSLKSKKFTLDSNAGIWARNRIIYASEYSETVEFCDDKDFELAKEFLEDEEPDITPEEIEECFCLSTAIQAYTQLDYVEDGYLYEFGFNWKNIEACQDYYLVNHDKGEYLNVLSYAKRIVNYLKNQLHLSDPYNYIVYPLLLLTLHIEADEEINDEEYIGAWKGQRISLSFNKPVNSKEITPLFYFKDSSLYL